MYPTERRFFARIHHRLVRLYNILQESNRKVEAERQELQSLGVRYFPSGQDSGKQHEMIVDTLLTKSLKNRSKMSFLKV